MDESNTIYSEQLAKTSSHHRIVAREDVYNESGAKLLTRGQAITAKSKDLIIRHRLLKPLEQSVTIEDSLDARAMYRFINRFAGTVPRIQSIINNDQYQSELRKLCVIYDRQPLIRQKLTVLSTQMPETYSRAVFSAISGLAVAMRMELSEEDKKAAFFGGLLHDIGLLHLPENLRQPSTTVGADELRRYYSHTVIAQQFCKQLKGVPKSVSSAVANHHERVDGSGNPRQRVGNSLCKPSQIIAITDIVFSAYSRYRVFGDYCHNMLLTILQLNNNVHYEEIYRATVYLFKSTDTAKLDTPGISTIESILPTLEKNHKSLLRRLKVFREVSLELMKHGALKAAALGSMTGRIATSVIQSGLLQKEHSEWLKKISSDSTHSSEDLELAAQTHAIQQEITYQLQRLRNILVQAASEIGDLETSSKFLEQLDQADAA